MKTRIILLAAAILGVCGPSAARADDEDEARRIALLMAKQAAIEFLTDREFEFEGDALVGTAKAVEPAEHVRVEIKDFLFVPGRVTVTFDVGARFEFDGAFTVDDKKIEVEGTADVQSKIDFVADYQAEQDRLRIDARATDAEFEVDVLKLTPDSFPGGNNVAEELTEKELRGHKDEMLRELNEWIEEFTKKIEPE